MKLFKSLHSKGREYFHNLLTLDLTSHKISQSLAVGIFIGLTIPMGLQMIAVLPLVFLFRCNLPLACGATLISNPFTILPIYITAVFIGERVTGIKISLREINYVINNPTINNFWNIGYNTLMVLVSGTVVIGMVFSVLVYYLALHLITKHREKIKQRSDIHP